MRKIVIVAAISSALLLGIMLGHLGALLKPTMGEIKKEGAAVVVKTSWRVSSECSKGSDPCAAVLRKANDNSLGLIFFEDGSAVVK